MNKKAGKRRLLLARIANLGKTAEELGDH